MWGYKTEVMESIYKTRWGSYVDLSKIVMIDPVQNGYLNMVQNCYIDMVIHFQLMENPVNIDIFAGPDKPKGTEGKNEFKQDLIDAWYKFKNQRPDADTNVVFVNPLDLAKFDLSESIRLIGDLLLAHDQYGELPDRVIKQAKDFISNNR